MNNKKELKIAFLNTSYTIKKNKIFKEDIVLKIGEKVDFSSMLPNLKEWAFITAWNPLPNILSNEQNKQRNSLLSADLKKQGFQYHLARGISEDGKWFEDSFFIENISKRKARFYAKKFGQLAFVYCAKNATIELVFT